MQPDAAATVNVTGDAVVAVPPEVELIESHAAGAFPPVLVIVNGVPTLAAVERTEIV